MVVIEGFFTPCEMYVHKQILPEQFMPTSSVSGNVSGKANVVLSRPALLTVTSDTSLHTTTKYFPRWYWSAGGLNAALVTDVPLHNDVTVACTSGHPEIHTLP